VQLVLHTILSSQVNCMQLTAVSKLPLAKKVADLTE